MQIGKAESMTFLVERLKSSHVSWGLICWRGLAMCTQLGVSPSNDLLFRRALVLKVYQKTWKRLNMLKRMNVDLFS